MTNIMNDFPAAGVSQGGDAFNVAIYAIVSMVVLAGISFLLSRIFNNRKMEDWAKDEFIQVLISAAIVGALFALLAPGSGVIIKVFNTMIPASISIPVYQSGGPLGFHIVSATNCPMDNASGTILCFAYDYLYALQKSISSMCGDIMIINTILDIVSKVSFDVIIVQVTPLSGLSAIVQVLNSSVQSLLFISMIASIQMCLLVFINNTALQIFLPIGVVLRCFFATRRIGGLLMAIALGLYLVFPLAISLNAIAAQQATDDSINSFVSFYSQVQHLNPTNYFTDPGDLSSISKWNLYFSDYTPTLSSMLTVIKSIPNTLSSIIASMAVQIIFLPILSVLITLAAIKELAALFGSEANLSRFEV